VTDAKGRTPLALARDGQRRFLAAELRPAFAAVFKAVVRHALATAAGAARTGSGGNSGADADPLLVEDILRTDAGAEEALAAVASLGATAAAAYRSPTDAGTFLHVALSREPPDPAVALALLQAYPAWAALESETSGLPLHVICSKPHFWAAEVQATWLPFLAALLEASPAWSGARPLLLRRHGTDSNTPLHLALLFHAPLPVLEALLAAAQWTEAGRALIASLLPFALLIHAADEPTLFALMHASPQTAGAPVLELAAAAGGFPAAAARDRDGLNEPALEGSCCALHLAVARVARHTGPRVSPAFVLALAAAAPAAALAQNANGETPLHVAVSCWDEKHPAASLDVVAALLAIAPSAASVARQGGATPLHDAAREGTSVELVAALLAAAPPGAVAVADAEGRTPLQLADSRTAKPGVVAALQAAAGAVVNA
jgi:hypothetical protein